MQCLYSCCSQVYHFFEYRADNTSFPFFSHLFFFPYKHISSCNFLTSCFPLYLIISGMMLSPPGALPFFNFAILSSISSHVGISEFSPLSLSSIFNARSYFPWSLQLGYSLFSASLKCSTHLFIIYFLSNKTFPSLFLHASCLGW